MRDVFICTVNLDKALSAVWRLPPLYLAQLNMSLPVRETTVIDYLPLNSLFPMISSFARVCI